MLETIKNKASFKVGDEVGVRLLNGPYKTGFIINVDGILFVNYNNGKMTPLKSLLTNRAFTVIKEN